MIQRIVAFLLLFATIGFAERGIILPQVEKKDLKVVGRLDFEPIKESSGLVQSRTWPNVFWTHNDSGDTARIFAVSETGAVIRPKWMKDSEYSGIELLGAHNIDWEDIAIDSQGHLYIGEFGNNKNARRDLGIYILREPNPFDRTAMRVLSWIPFEYPDQKQYPPSPENRNYDAEALFFANGHLYVLTKHRGNTKTKLYRLESLRPNHMNRLIHLGTFDTKGSVSGADTSRDGKRLVVLTSKALWLFEIKDENPESWFEGRVSWLPFRNGRNCEGVCFSEHSIVISNEERDLFMVKRNDLHVLRK